MSLNDKRIETFEKLLLILQTNHQTRDDISLQVEPFGMIGLRIIKSNFITSDFEDMIKEGFCIFTYPKYGLVITE